MQEAGVELGAAIGLHEAPERGIEGARANLGVNLLAQRPPCSARSRLPRPKVSWLLTARSNATQVMAWVAFDRAVKSHESFGRGNRERAEHWWALREEITPRFARSAFDASLGSFVQSYGSAELDASLLQIPILGFLPADDPRVVGTVAAIERGLMVDGFVMRYRSETAPDGLPAGEGAFLACSFWLVDAYVLQGRWDEARALFERLVALVQRCRPPERGI